MLGTAISKMIRILLFVLCAFITSCALSPVEPSQMTADESCIKGGMANFIGHFTRGEAHVAINPQNGNQGGPYSEHCLPAGKNTILVAAAGGPGLGANALVIVSLQAGHRYKVRAVHNDGKYLFFIVDTTGDSENIAYRFNIPLGYYGKNIFTGETGDPIDLTDRLRQE